MSEEEEEVASSEDVMSGLAPFAACAGCRHLRRKCVPDCAFAPYFSPEDRDRFAAVHSVFGASNVSKLLAELEPEQRADAVESLVYQAMARQRDPAFGCVSYITILRDMLKQAKGQVAAAREELAQHVGPAAAFQPFDPAAAPPLAKQMGETQLAATLQLSKEKDDKLRAMREGDETLRKQPEKDAVVGRMGPSVPGGHGQKQANQQMTRQMAEAQRAVAAAQAAREQAVMMQQAVAAPQCRKHAVAQHGGMGRGFPDGQIHGHPRQKMVQRMAQAPESSAAVAQAAREQAMMMQQAAAAQQHRHPLAQHGAGLALPDGRVHGHLGQQIADAQKSAAADQVARWQWQDTMLMRQVAASRQKLMLQQAQQMAKAQQLQNQQTALQMAEAAKLATTAEVTTEQDLMMQVMRQAAAEEQYYNAAVQYTVMGHDASLGHQLPHPQMEQAQQLAAAEAIAREQDMMIRRTAAAAGLTTDQYMMMMMMQQQDVAGGMQHHGEAEQYAALGLTRDQNMTMMQQAVAEQQQMAQQIANAQQLSAAAEVAWEQELMMMQQQAAAYAQAMPGRGSGATIMPFLPGGSANADAFLVQQQPQPQPQTVNAFGPQVEHSLPPLPPSLADLPRQQPNDGGDEGQSSDLIARYWNQYPNLPPDGRQ